MKKNWGLIVLCLGFILGWQAFVLGPYQTKQRALQAVKTKPVDTAVAPTTAVPGNNSPVVGVTGAALPVAGNLNVADLSEEDMKQAIEVAANEKRSFKLLPDFSIGSATFHDYVVRGSKTATPVVIMKENLRWSSTDPDVQACLNGLRQGALNGSMLSREFKTSQGGYCRVRLAADPSKPGLVHMEIALNGFTQKPGAFLEFKGSDEIGAGEVTDHNHFGYLVDDSQKWVKEKDLYESTRKEGKVDWVAWGDKYFVTALLPKGTYNPNVIYGPASTDKKGKVVFGVQYPVFSRPDGNATYELSVYFGTRDPEQLKEIDPKLARAVDLGFFGVVARVLMWALNKLNIVFHNFGVSIIVLTLLVRLAFWPLNKKVFLSGLKMRALQPEIERIRAKYGTDKSKAEQMNRELLGLYRIHKVNPAGSCLPLLLQLPIFIGLYAALGHSLDLYQAPFVGWIHDLSSKDPFYVFPFLWTVSLLFYMKLNPQGMNPQPGQPDMKWLMVGMNIFFGYLSKDWPAGLTLYLFVSNLVGILQQVMLKRDQKLQPIQEGV